MREVPPNNLRSNSNIAQIRTLVSQIEPTDEQVVQIPQTTSLG
ncbi:MULTISPECIES: hypothetical protein [Oscillatoriales]|nr:MULTISPECIES: hypothetical protein [Oscillatoriales]